MSVKDAFLKIKDQVAEAAKRAGRDPEDISIIAVSKTIELPKILEAIDAGAEIIAENKIQEARLKYDAVKGKASFHFIGHLQRNKVKDAVKMFDLIHSVDRISLAEELSAEAKKRNKIIEVFVEVKTSIDPNKYGISPEEALKLIEEILKLPNLKLSGLMTIADFTDNEDKIRGCFSRLRELKEKINIPELKYLSMGMTDDFEIAIEEGSNMVRVGSGIFRG